MKLLFQYGEVSYEFFALDHPIMWGMIIGGWANIRWWLGMGVFIVYVLLYISIWKERKGG
jgi:hypothetical protein